MRYEFPQDWCVFFSSSPVAVLLTTSSRPDGISSLINFLRSSTQPGANPLQLPRTLTILLQIIKELSTARLQRTRTNLQSVAPEIFHLLGSIYVDKVNKWVSLLEQGVVDEGALLESLEQSLVSLKVVRRLVIAGYEHPNRHNEVKDFWLLTHSHFSRFLQFISGSISLPENVHKAVEKHVLQLSKLHVEMAKDRAASFALLPDSISLVRSYWSLVVKLGVQQMRAVGILVWSQTPINSLVSDENRVCIVGLVWLAWDITRDLSWFVPLLPSNVAIGSYHRLKQVSKIWHTYMYKQLRPS